MKRITIALISLHLLLYGCGNDPRDHIKKIQSAIKVSNDGEVASPSWINKECIKESQHAHSGNHVFELDSNMIYSVGFKKNLGDISNKELEYVIISAWIYVDSIPKPFKELSLVASVNDGSATVFYVSVPVEDSITQSKKWFFVSQEQLMRFDQHPTNSFTGYVMNNSKTKILVDDIIFRFIEK